MAVGDDPENRVIGSEIYGDRSVINPPPSPAPLSSSSQRTPWLIPLFAVTKVILFSIAMFVNNCPNHSDSHAPNHHCVAAFLGRLSFEPLWNNPLFGPSSRTYVYYRDRIRGFDINRVAPVYVVSGVGGSIVSSLFIRNSVSVGASGPLYLL